jgi:hypothetical protein
MTGQCRYLCSGHLLTQCNNQQYLVALMLGSSEEYFLAGCDGRFEDEDEQATYDEVVLESLFSSFFSILFLLCTPSHADLCVHRPRDGHLMTRPSTRRPTRSCC